MRYVGILFSHISLCNFLLINLISLVQDPQEM